MSAPEATVGAGNSVSGYGLNEFDGGDRFFGVSVKTVRRWHAEGTGPRWRKVGFLVRYALADLQAYWDQLPEGGYASMNPKRL